MAVGTAVVAASPDEGRDVVQLLARIGARVEQYFARAQSIICRETVHLQPLSSDLTFDGSHVRKLVYELRVAWEATEGKAPEATVLRELVSIDGRPPKQGDEPGCMDPKAVWIVTENRITNQHGRVVAIGRGTVLFHRRPDEVAADTEQGQEAAR